MAATDNQRDRELGEGRLSEALRRECEAREWLARMKRDPVAIKALLLRIGERRGKVAAEQLRDDMRLEWVK